MVLAVALLYTVALLGLPALYSSFTARNGSGMAARGSGGDLPAAALAEGVLQPPALARALSGRRVALERGGGAAAELWPGAGLTLPLAGSQVPQLPRVEYRDAGAKGRKGQGSCTARCSARQCPLLSAIPPPPG